MQAMTVLVAGGSGFVGSHVVAKLSASGMRVLVPTRRYERAKHLIFLPRVEVIEADLNDPETCARLTHKVNAVINLVGVRHARSGTPYGPEFAQAHVQLPRQLVAACGANHVRRYLHMSALGANADGPSMYLRSKGDGEQEALNNTSVAATIMRPSMIYGPQDKTMNTFACLQKYLPVLALGGAGARLQPVYVEDVAQAFVNALAQLGTRWQTYELAGPQAYTLAELVHMAGRYAGHPSLVLPLGPGLARLQAAILEHLPGQLLSRDMLASLMAGSVLSEEPHTPRLDALGIRPAAMEAVLRRYLGRPLPRFDEYRGRAGR